TFHVLCVNKNTGDILWNEVVHKGVPKVKRHPKATHANSTCATDGKHIVACFGSEGLYCYDAAGKQLWKQELGLLESAWFYDADYQWGFGSSPIIYKNLAIVQSDAVLRPGPDLRHERLQFAAADLRDSPRRHRRHHPAQGQEILRRHRLEQQRRHVHADADRLRPASLHLLERRRRHLLRRQERQ